MSKKSKSSPGKTGSKSPVKKAVKPAAKKSATKQPAAKPVQAKKAAPKPVAKSKTATRPAKASSTSGTKKAPVNKPVASSKSKPVSKSAVKKTVVKKAAAPKKIIAKKTAAKPAPKNTKPAVVKKPEAKKEKPVVVSAKAPRELPKPVPVDAAEEKGKKLSDAAAKKQQLEKRAQEVLAITNTIPVKTASEISASKIASISHSITNPIKKTDSYAIKPEKEPAGKFELEFVVHSSSEMLYEFLSTPSGLSEWFCDDLNIRNGIYTFIWDDQLQQARLLKTVELQLVRFQWVDKTDGSYFEFRIQRDDLTNDISLIITDFADSVSERESSKLLWNSQIEKLMHVIGSIF